jgi:predicted RNA-binding protein with PIN domain
MLKSPAASGVFQRVGFARQLRRIPFSGTQPRAGAVPQCARTKAQMEFPFSLCAIKGYDAPMALVRILVDGYSLLHNWPELAPGRRRHSARAREELIHVLTRYHDATGTPVTIFFDGSGAPAGTPPPESNPAVEVLFSCAGQTADDMIERAAHRFSAYGEVLAVTDDVAERDTVTGMGGLASSCANFIRTIENALAELQDELQNYNRTERNRFNRSHQRDLK